MKKKLKNLAVLIFLVMILILPYFVFAEETAAPKSSPLKRLEKVGVGEGAYAAANEDKMSEIAGIAVRAFLSLLGVIFLILIIYAGYNWMTAAGDEQKVTKAKDTLTRAVIGLIITLGAYAIWYFVWIKLI